MFEWNEEKRVKTLEKHGIDFLDAAKMLAGPCQVKPSERNGEPRWLAIGMLDGREIAVVFTKRGENTRLISARRARDNERKAYHARFT